MTLGYVFFQLGQKGEGSHVAVHAENAFRHDDDSGKIMMVLFQQGLQLRVVLMAVADTFAADRRMPSIRLACTNLSASIRVCASATAGKMPVFR